MKRTWTVTLALTLVFLSIVSAYAQEPIPLGSLKAVSGGIGYDQKKVSIADHFFGSIIVSAGYDFATFDLGGKYSRLEGYFGVNDNKSSLQNI